MPQNIYSLPELIDLALNVPEVGAVNFNILHTILKSIVKELNLTDVRPWCHVESPLLAKTALTQAKFRGEDLKRIPPSTSAVPERVLTSEREDYPVTQATEEDKIFEKDEETSKEMSVDVDEYSTAKRKESTIHTEEIETSEEKPIDVKEHPPAERKESTVQAEEIKTPEEKPIDVKEHPPAERKESTVQTDEIETSDEKSTIVKEHPRAERKESTVQTEEIEISKEKPIEVKEHLPAERKESTVQTEEIETSEKKSIDLEKYPKAEEKELRDVQAATISTEAILESQDLDTEIDIFEPEELLLIASEESITAIEKKLSESILRPPKTIVQPKMPKRRIAPVTPQRGAHPGGDKWKYINLSIRVRALEEGLNRLSNIVDKLADHIIKSAQRRREGGPSSEELEAFDDRILALEDALALLAADHKLLMELRDQLQALLEEFEAIKALASLLKQMQIDISKKADKEETWAALDKKADVALVDSKVDRWEFEIAIEELGEAIGLLGLKFRRKNDEWEERAAEIWKAIDSKMTFDVFEAARIKIESRLTALMYGLRKLKKVVEDLLYPAASGVTRCILCRRPACISGLECMAGIRIGDSPKRPLSSGDTEDPEKIRKTLNDIIAKRQKLEVPPYCESPDTIIRIPYSSASYRSSVDDQEFGSMTQEMKLQPVAAHRGSASSRKSQIPKLPDIDSSSSKTSAKTVSFKIPKTKSNSQKSELYFTKKMLSKAERKRSSPKDEKRRLTVVTEVKSSKKATSVISSMSLSSSVDLTPDPAKIMEDFMPAKRSVLLSPSSPKEKPNISLSPLQFQS